MSSYYHDASDYTDYPGETIYSGGENYGYHVNSIESSWNVYPEEVIPEIVSGGGNYGNPAAGDATYGTQNPHFGEHYGNPAAGDATYGPQNPHFGEHYGNPGAGDATYGPQNPHFGNVEYELRNDPNPMRIGVPFDSFDSIVFSDDDEDGDIIAKYSREWKEIVKTAFEKGYVLPPLSPLTPSDSEASYESDEDESKVVETYFQRNASTLDICTKEKNTYESDGQRVPCFQRSATTTRDISTKEKNTLSSDRLAAKFRKQHSSNSLSMAEKRKDKEADVLRRATTEQSEVPSKKTAWSNSFTDKFRKQLSLRTMSDSVVETSSDVNTVEQKKPRSRKALKTKTPPSGNEANILAGKISPIWK